VDTPGYVPVSGNGPIGYAWTGRKQDIEGNHADSMVRARGPGDDDDDDSEEIAMVGEKH
jgi:hypothetical protein